MPLLFACKGKIDREFCTFGKVLKKKEDYVVPPIRTNIFPAIINPAGCRYPFLYFFF